MNEPFAFYEKTAEYVKQRAPFVPEIALILGTGLGPLAGQIENPVTLDYREIPNFLVSTAPDHAGKLIFGTLEGKKLVCMSGRFHTYEGYDFEQLSIPVRLFKLLGVKQVIVTNAAGGVNEGYRPGDIMVISDHIKLNGASPMRGKNLPEFGDRFFDVSRMYTPRLRELALRLAKGTKLRVHEGVYFFMPGPQFETPAEIRAFRALGADAVGMSTVPEVIAASHAGMKVLGFSLITNMAAGILQVRLSGDEVIAVGERQSKVLVGLVRAVVEAL